MEFNSSVVRRMETTEIVCMLGKQPVTMSVASESGRPGLSMCLSVKRIPQKAFHRANKGEVLRLGHNIGKNKHKDKSQGIVDVHCEMTC